MTLMERLLEAGYPRKEMDNHASDLYVYRTPLTDRVIQQWCDENGYTRGLFVKPFRDNVTGRPR